MSHYHQVGSPPLFSENNNMKAATSYHHYRQQCDSGLGSLQSMPVQADCGTYNEAPPRPKLMVLEDAENGDSGINMNDDDTERDCINTIHQDIPSRVPIPEPKTATRDVVPPKNVSTVVTPLEPLVPVQVYKQKKGGPRIPKRTVTGPPTVSNHSVRTVTAPHRSTSPKTVYSQSHSAPHMYQNPIVANVRHQGGHCSMPTPSNSSPLTCNNFHSLNLDRVPPVMSEFSLDIRQLKQYMDSFLPDKEGDTGFHLAVIHSEPDLLDKLLFIMSKDSQLQSIIDEQNGLYQTALHLATHLQQVEMMRKLLIAGASINITDHKGNTPLHIAAKFSSTRPLEEIMRYISIQTISEVAHVRNYDGQSCVHVAAKNGNTEILHKLRSIGVDMDIQDLNSGKTPLHLVAENGVLADVQFLLETCEADVNSLTYSGCSPLHIASGRGDISLVAYLISMGADPELLTDEGDMAMDLAGSQEVLSFLTKVDALKWLY